MAGSGNTQVISAQFTADVDNFVSAMGQVVDAAKAVKGSAADLADALDQTGSGVSTASSAAKQASSGFSDMVGTLAEIGSAALETGKAILDGVVAFKNFGTTVGDTVKSLFDVNMATENAAVSFKYLTGNAAVSQDLLKQLAEFAATTPFKFTDIRDAASQLLSMGVNAKDVIPELKSLGEALAAGAGPEASANLDNVIQTLARMGSQSKLAAQDIDQLAREGFPVWQALAAGLGVSVDEAMAKVQAGAISGTQAIDAMMKGADKLFSGSLNDQLNTTSGQVNKLDDNWNKLWQTLSKPAFDSTEEGLKGLNSALAGVASQIDKINSDAHFDVVGQQMKVFTDVMSGDFVQVGVDLANVNVDQQQVASSSQQMSSAVQSSAPAMSAASSSASSASGTISNLHTSVQTLGTSWTVTKTSADSFTAAISTAGTTGGAVSKVLDATGKSAGTLSANFKDASQESVFFQGQLDKIAEKNLNLQQQLDLASKGVGTLKAHFSDLNGNPVDLHTSTTQVDNLKDHSNALIDVLKTLWDWLKQVSSASSSDPSIPRLGMPAFASGVENFSGGLALVGEAGPEILSLPRGSSVYPMSAGAPASASSLKPIGMAAGSAGASGPITVQLMIESQIIAEAVFPQLAPVLRGVAGRRY